jgi:shikimate 5-dehydrogenase
MLIHQGARSFMLWTGLDAPVEVMRQAVVTEQQRRAAG